MSDNDSTVDVQALAMGDAEYNELMPVALTVARRAYGEARVVGCVLLATVARYSAVRASFAQDAATAEKAQAEADRLRAERGFLAEAIAAAVFKAGIYNGEAPLTGPHLVLLCRDMANQIVRQTAIADATLALARAYRKACPVRVYGADAEDIGTALDALRALGVEP